MKIAIIGSRGIPAKYGGFETFAEGLSTKLVKKGYDITVTCEYEPPESRNKEYNGVKLEYFPLKPPKSYFLRKFYENISDIYFLIKLSRSYNSIYFLGIEVGMFLFIPKLLKRRSKLFVNIDGVMWKRTKFNMLERSLLKLNHIFATIFADKIIADAEEMKNYVMNRYRSKTVFISYGINLPSKNSWEKKNLKKLNSINELKDDSNIIISNITMYGASIPTKIKKTNYSPLNLFPDKYWLVVARLEPENNIHTIVEAFSKIKTKYPLVIVGDFTDNDYKKEVYSLTGEHKNIHFLGSIYDIKLLNMLRQNCFAYFHGHTVGGTNPSLLEAMSMENIIVAHENQFNREVCGNCAIYFEDSFNLKEKIELIENNPENYQKLKQEALYRVKNGYLWDKIISEYDLFFKKELKDPISLTAKDLNISK
ncbi:DUF1972 domain-containing protein [Methanobacterium sp.]|uniref:DUF1972 domain-containing protein n=1 Tax=Methanobacterium sp. TaxID=2164 RepID=UPI003C708C24